MKLVIAIVHDEDSQFLVEEFTVNNLKVTKLASTGGFLKSGNTTLLIGTEEKQVDKVIDIIKNNCETRKQIVTAQSPVSGASGAFIPYPVEVKVGGATVFVMDIEKHLKL
ncbi:MAG: cyclic-di-AMP receptor [Clostridiales bacterium]|nr:cyclic-di-AMP receptor [Clostridiales bacterium]